MNRSWIAPFLPFALACSDGVSALQTGSLELASPVDGFQLFSKDALTIKASAADTKLLQSVKLYAGDYLVKACAADPVAESIDCKAELTAADVAAQVKDGVLEVRAVSLDDDDGERSRTARVTVTSLAVNLIEPLGPQAKGTGQLKVSVRGEVPATLVQVSYDDGWPLRQWTQEPYEAEIDWAALVGLCSHKLIATVVDSASRTATHQRELLGRTACGLQGT